MRQSADTTDRATASRQTPSCLIYTVALGARYRHLARNLFRSIRVNGCYQVESAVITDEPSDLDLSQCTCVAPRGFDGTPASAFLSKVDNDLPMNGVDVVMYLDADVLCIGPLLPVIDQLPEQDVVVYCVEPRPIGRRRRHFKPFAATMSPELFARCRGRPGISGGFFMLRATAYRRFAELWRAEIRRKCVGHFTEQCALNHIVYSGQFPAAPLRDGCMVYPPRHLAGVHVPSGAALAHFYGHLKRIYGRYLAGLVTDR